METDRASQELFTCACHGRNCERPLSDPEMDELSELPFNKPTSSVTCAYPDSY